MATFTLFHSFREAIAEEKHNFASDTLKIALCAAANPPVVGNSVLADLTQIAYTNLSSRVLVVSSSSQAAGLYKLKIDNLILSAAGGNVAAWQYIVIYNDTATNDELIGYSDYGAPYIIVDGTVFNVNFNQTNGLFTINTP